MILISVEQVLNDEHDAQIPAVRILGEQIGHSLVHIVHLVVYDDQVRLRDPGRRNLADLGRIRLHTIVDKRRNSTKFYPAKASSCVECCGRIS